MEMEIFYNVSREFYKMYIFVSPGRVVHLRSVLLSICKFYKL